MTFVSDLNKMSFIEHLKDLRKCIIRICLGLFLCAGGALYWSKNIFDILTQPIYGSFQNFEIIGTGPAEAFVIKLQVSIIAGMLISSPNIFLQLWLFIAPGLYPKERKVVIPFVFFSTILFLGGTYFCYSVMFPYAFEYFYQEYVSIGLTPNIKIDEYLGFVVRLILVFGIVFELPIFCFFLAKLKILSHTWLLSNFRYIILGIFIVAGILTPPDVVSQILLAAPLIIIYAICIVITYVFYPRL
jgi:sec-independent protein translocase protein TatC